jgi:SAM-dependent methyltransferase
VNPEDQKVQAIKNYLENGRKPWSLGYLEYRAQSIKELLALHTSTELFQFPENYGLGLDERLAEYSWIISRIPPTPARILDAGSTFNFDYILDQKKFAEKDLSICTFYPEPECFFSRRISYNYADLRSLPYRNDWFDMVVCQSTLEHIDMDNSIYGYNNREAKPSDRKSYEFLNAVSELVRVLKPDGKLLITVPFGKFENHGFFQQFDIEMKNRMMDSLKPYGKVQDYYFKYTSGGWVMSNEQETSSCESYNPHTGKGKGTDGAAHCRGILAVEMKKS